MALYRLEDEFSNGDLELGLLHYLLEHPEELQRHAAVLRPELFAVHSDLLSAVQSGSPKPELPTAQTPIADLPPALLELERLHRMRLLARLQEKTAGLLFSGETDPTKVLAHIETGINTLRPVIAPVESATSQPAAQLAKQILRDAAHRVSERKRTGKAIQGVPTGLTRVDALLNGLTPGLHVIAAGPGVGKTTLCLQWALHAALQGFPVVYVTYENSPSNLMLKLLSSRSQQSPSQVERGFADLLALEKSAAELAGALPRLTFVEGTRKLALAHIEAVALEMMKKCEGAIPLVVFDYLQRAAHGLGYEQLRHNVSALSAEMRELATRLGGPMIAISSQNRSVGEYGKGGRPALDSLKESGDLEYGADTVMILHTREGAPGTESVRPVELSVVKNRFGALGQVPLVFRADVGVFREEA